MKIKMRIHSYATFQRGLLLLFLMSVTIEKPVLAQANVMNDDGNLQTVGRHVTNYVDYLVPKEPAFSHLVLTARGADGGYCKFEPRPSAGEGATTLAVFQIGDGDHEIPPGSTLRFIVGTAGHKGNSNGGGGGGTGILLKKKNAEAWAILMVAGGGGGSHVVPLSGGKKGNPGNDDPSGDGGSGGSTYPRATGGHSTLFQSGDAGGDGALSCWEGIKGGGENEVIKTLDEDGFYHANPIGKSSMDLKPSGGFGFGRGCPGSMGGGGGGGYSGGGNGDNSGGGGGGSYINPAWARSYYIQKNGQTKRHMDGYVQFQFTNEAHPVYRIHLAKSPQKCIDLSGGNTTNQTNIQLYTCTGSSNQAWAFDGRSIKLMKDKTRCLDAYYGNNQVQDGTNVQLYDCNGGPNQQWIYDGRTKAFRSVADLDKCLYLENGSTTDKTNISLKTCDESTAQQWQFDDTTSPNTIYQLQTFHLVQDARKCLDLKDAGTTNGTNIQLGECDGSATQAWLFDGLKVKLNKSPDKCLDVYQSNTDNTTNIELFSCHKGNNQQWIYDGITKLIRSRIDVDKCIHVSRNRTDVGANIYLYDCSPGSTAQKWVLQTP